jgi:hypothetical protein
LVQVGDPEPGIGCPALSPDGRQVIMPRGEPPEIRLLTLDRPIWTRVTNELVGQVRLHPIWSPDGDRIVFSALPKGAWDLYEKPTHGAGSPQLLWASPPGGIGVFALDWSLDGRFILYRIQADPNTRADIWALPVERKRSEPAGEQKPIAVVQTPFDDYNAKFSPDGNPPACSALHRPGGGFIGIGSPAPLASIRGPSRRQAVPDEHRDRRRQLPAVHDDLQLQAAASLTKDLSPAGTFPARFAP